jgi:hypothetical protein
MLDGFLTRASPQDSTRTEMKTHDRVVQMLLLQIRPPASTETLSIPLRRVLVGGQGRGMFG